MVTLFSKPPRTLLSFVVVAFYLAFMFFVFYSPYTAVRFVSKADESACVAVVLLVALPVFWAVQWLKKPAGWPA